MNCSKCKGPVDEVPYFKIARIDHSGAETVSASVCSLTCMLGWAQDYAAMAGLKAVFTVQQKIESAKRTYEAIKGMFKRS